MTLQWKSKKIRKILPDAKLLERLGSGLDIKMHGTLKDFTKIEVKINWISKSVKIQFAIDAHFPEAIGDLVKSNS